MLCCHFLRTHCIYIYIYISSLHTSICPCVFSYRGSDSDTDTFCVCVCVSRDDVRYDRLCTATYCLAQCFIPRIIRNTDPVSMGAKALCRLVGSSTLHESIHISVLYSPLCVFTDDMVWLKQKKKRIGVCLFLLLCK